jgi:hypothetical protein
MSTNTINWQEELPPDAQQRREVFARFGLVAYQAQCLERQIGILLAATYNSDFLQSTPSEQKAFFEREFTKVLGRLVSDLNQRVHLTPEFEFRLRRGLKYRNKLIHNYFWERAGSFLTWDGREKMICELQEATDFLGALDSELTDLSEKWAAKVGVSKDAIEAQLAKYKRGENA